MAKAIIS